MGVYNGKERWMFMYMDSFFWGGGFEIMFTLVFITIIGIFVVTAVKGLGQWNKNN